MSENITFLKKALQKYFAPDIAYAKEGSAGPVDQVVQFCSGDSQKLISLLHVVRLRIKHDSLLYSKGQGPVPRKSENPGIHIAQ